MGFSPCGFPAHLHHANTHTNIHVPTLLRAVGGSHGPVIPQPPPVSVVTLTGPGLPGLCRCVCLSLHMFVPTHCGTVTWGWSGVLPSADSARTHTHIFSCYHMHPKNSLSWFPVGMNVALHQHIHVSESTHARR